MKHIKLYEEFIVTESIKFKDLVDTNTAYVGLLQFLHERGE